MTPEKSEDDDDALEAPYNVDSDDEEQHSIDKTKNGRPLSLVDKAGNCPPGPDLEFSNR